MLNLGIQGGGIQRVEQSGWSGKEHRAVSELGAATQQNRKYYGFHLSPTESFQVLLSSSALISQIYNPKTSMRNKQKISLVQLKQTFKLGLN